MNGNIVDELTKWPRLLVSGVQVTPEQANEILIRTCVPEYLAGNDRQWDEIVGRILRMPLRDDWHEIQELRDSPQKRLDWLRLRWAEKDARVEELGILGLEYLYTSRIASSYLGGPHGWCDWNGNIWTDSYNIGKWPETETLTEEWGRIAEAFPYLDLTAQVVTDEGAGELAGEWRVKDGEVCHYFNPTAPILQKSDDQGQMLSNVLNLVYNPERERGVSVDRLTQAVAQVDASMAELRARGGLA